MINQTWMDKWSARFSTLLKPIDKMAMVRTSHFWSRFGITVPLPSFPLFDWGDMVTCMFTGSDVTHKIMQSAAPPWPTSPRNPFLNHDDQLWDGDIHVYTEDRRFTNVHVNSLTFTFEADLKCRFSRRFLNSEQILTVSRKSPLDHFRRILEL